MGYRELIEWDRKHHARPVVFGHDADDSGTKSTEEDARVDW